MTLVELLEAVKTAPEEELPGLAATVEAARVALALRLNAPRVPERVPPAEVDRNVDIREASDLTGMSVGWLRKHLRTLPFSVHVGRRRLFSTDGIRKWNEANKRQTRAERA